MNDSLPQKIEGLLFALGKPLPHKVVMEMTGATKEELLEAITVLQSQKERGLVLVDDASSIELRTAPELNSFIEAIRRAENSRDIGRAGLEVLSAVLYKGPLSRTEIDFIRGVNSSQILRTLTTRGLLRRKQNPKDERQLIYEATTELLATLGATHARDLPDFDLIKEKLTSLQSGYTSELQNTDV